MMMLRLLGVVMVCGCLALPVGAQGKADGAWYQDYDEGGGAKLEPPKDAAVVATPAKASFAEGDCEAKLAKDESGFFLWVHLHGVHNDRLSITKTVYNGAILVKNKKSGRYLMATPPIEMEVKGAEDKPDRHKHAYGQFTPDAATAALLQKVLDGKGEFEVEIAMSRKRKDGEVFAEILKGPVKDALLAYFGVKDPKALAAAAVELLKKLNEGKKE